MAPGIPIDEWSGSDAVDALHDTIKDYQTVAEKQTRTLITLTRVIVFLTLVLIAGLGVQIWVELRPL